MTNIINIKIQSIQVRFKPIKVKCKTEKFNYLFPPPGARPPPLIRRSSFPTPQAKQTATSSVCGTPNTRLTRRPSIETDEDIVNNALHHRTRLIRRHWGGTRVGKKIYVRFTYSVYDLPSNTYNKFHSFKEYVIKYKENCVTDYRAFPDDKSIDVINRHRLLSFFQ